MLLFHRDNTNTGVGCNLTTPAQFCELPVCKCTCYIDSVPVTVRSSVHLYGLYMPTPLAAMQNEPKCSCFLTTIQQLVLQYMPHRACQNKNPNMITTCKTVSSLLNKLVHFTTMAVPINVIGCNIIMYMSYMPVFCPGFQKGRVPSEKGTFSAVNGPSKGHH